MDLLFLKNKLEMIPLTVTGFEDLRFQLPSDIRSLKVTKSPQIPKQKSRPRGVSSPVSVTDRVPRRLSSVTVAPTASYHFFPLYADMRKT